jgi:hypothetical protein
MKEPANDETSQSAPTPALAQAPPLAICECTICGRTWGPGTASDVAAQGRKHGQAQHHFRWMLRPVYQGAPA